jgi:hypothetical protein
MIPSIYCRVIFRQDVYLKATKSVGTFKLPLRSSIISPAIAFTCRLDADYLILAVSFNGSDVNCDTHLHFIAIVFDCLSLISAVIFFIFSACESVQEGFYQINALNSLLNHGPCR